MENDSSSIYETLRNETNPSEDQQKEMEIPSALTADYIEMIYLCFVIIVGTPSNCFILRRLCQDLKRTPKDSVKAGFLILKINLNISDLLLLCILAFGKLLWLLMYQWPWGSALCKLYNFGSMVSLYISSNIVVCIALDRLRNVLGASKLRRGKGANGSVVHLLLIGSWFLAILWSIPQLIVWDVQEVVPGFSQCTDIWMIKKHLIHFGRAKESDYGFLYSTVMSSAYDISHLFFVFWGPLIVLIKCYVIIAIRLVKYSRRAPGQPSPMIRPDMTSGPSGVEQSISLHQFETASTTVSIDRHSTPRISGIRRSFDRYSERVPSPGLRSSSRLGSALPFTKYFHRNGHSMDNIFSKDDGTPPKKMSRVSDTLSGKVPAWRRQLRSKVFRTTLLVVIAHFLFWFPYNFLAIMNYINENLYHELSENANIFKDMQLLITLINPFLYGFTH
ncbi:unnamed protein product, partial [Mesorhabditis belari]|uniref:G-protein coupled receptors family 1 profile domain-containing protein n=1 Tax=Mesorhabditis belari TaxID=2138241 RepID=A0AAF3J8K3_9BILA